MSVAKVEAIRQALPQKLAMNTTSAVNRAYIILIFGENERLLVNPSCICVNMLAYIKDFLVRSGQHIDDKVSETFDLCTLSGNIVGVRRVAPYDYVGQLVKDRETYIPVVAEARTPSGGQLTTALTHDETDAVLTFVPLMSVNHRLYKQIVENLKRAKLVLTRSPETSQTGLPPQSSRHQRLVRHDTDKKKPSNMTQFTRRRSLNLRK